MTTQRPTPKFTGVDTYIDPKGRFHFRYPSDWHQHALADKREGTLFSPQATNPQTWFAIWVDDLNEHVVAEDLPVLRKGVEQGLSQLPECKVELSTDDVFNNLIKFERVFSFRHGDVTRKWRQWMLYVDHWLMVITYQGENPEEYDYWYAMVNYSFNTFQLPHELWFAVDRDLNGLPHVKEPTADARAATIEQLTGKGKK